jgi:hypothetical protein
MCAQFSVTEGYVDNKVRALNTLMVPLSDVEGISIMFLCGKPFITSNNNNNAFLIMAALFSYQ